MKALVFALPGSEAQADALCAALGAEKGVATLRSFPDGESYVRIDSDVTARPVVLVGSLERPDPKLLPLYFLAAAAREQGARCVGLVAPYLAYMRQDTVFRRGELITSAAFARLLSGFVDWLVTVDPHLHRHASLDEIYAIPSRVLDAAPVLAAWIRTHVKNPLLVGPDEESRPRIEAIASATGAPHTVLHKQRRGDRNVEISLPDLGSWRGLTPVLADDVISTGRTMIETMNQLAAAGFPAPVCIGVHAVFAGDAYRELRQAGARDIVTCDSVPHASNAIALAPLIASGVRTLLPSRAAAPGDPST